MRTLPNLVTSLRNIRCWDRTSNSEAQWGKTHIHRSYRRDIRQQLKLSQDWDMWDDAPKKLFTKWELY